MPDGDQSEKLSLVPAPFRRLFDSIDLSAMSLKTGDAHYFPFTGTASVILAGVGKLSDVSADSLRLAAAGCALACRKHRIARLHFVVPEIARLSPEAALTAITEAIMLAPYSFEKYKTRRESADKPLARAVIHSDHESADKIIARTRIICSNTLLCRDLVNETSDSSNPPAIAKHASALAKIRNVACRVFNEKEIEKHGMGLLKAVSRGASCPPRLVVLRYRGNPSTRESLAIVGKGITFDSGGMNLKSSGNIESMRSDMAGAATAMYVLKSAAELRLKINLYAVMPLAENMIGAASYRPGDVYSAYNGKTVEIGNTDAEGRLVLADALSFTIERYKPSMIIDIATLTGACVISLGEIAAGLFSTDDDLAGRLLQASETTGERVWRLPIFREYEDDIKSDIADMTNVSSKKQAGAIIGAVFLKNFVRKTPWAHLDIAGPAWYSKRRGHVPKNATGFGVRLLVEFLRNI